MINGQNILNSGNTNKSSVGGGAVNSVTGNIVDGSDPANPTVNQVQTDWNQSDSNQKDFIKNKPDVATSGVNSNITQLTGLTGALIQKYVSGNSGSTYAMDAVNGAFFDITLNNNCTITVSESIIAAQTQFFGARITQDGTGNRTLAWSGVTWASGVAPIMPTLAGAALSLSFVAINGSIIGFSQLQSADSLILSSLTLSSGILGVTNGSSAATGYVGETLSSIVPIASATSMTSGTAKSIASLLIPVGIWELWGNIGFIAAAGTLPTILEGSISSTNNAQATSPNNGAYFRNQITYPAGSTQICSAGKTVINITSPTTYYLVGNATFTVSTLTAYGALIARRPR